MNRLQHFFRAKTHYSLHSPFLYGLYTEVLFSAARPPVEARRSRYRNFVWRLSCHYGMPPTEAQHMARIPFREGEFLVMEHPYRRLDDWNRAKDDPFWQVTLDFYDVAIAIHNPHLSRQHLLLR